MQLIPSTPTAAPHPLLEPLFALAASLRGLIALSFIAAVSGCAPSETPANASAQDIQPGVYRLVLKLPGGDLPLGLELAREQSRWIGYFVNGPERLKLDEVSVQGTHLEIRMPGYENRLTADAQGHELRGEVILSKPGATQQRLPLLAQFHQNYRFFRTSTGSSPDVSGRWAVTFFPGDGSQERAVGEFSQSDDVVTGTFLTDGGDHRYLAGQVHGDELYLSTFDGAHAFLYKARISAAHDAMEGDFWYGTTFRQHWTGKRDPNASLADAYTLTAMRTAERKFEFAFPDPGHNIVTSRDSRFQGKVLIIALAGSWCPNCHDEAAFLAPLYREYRSRGLEIVSLMFENYGDFERAAAATNRFRQQYDIEYTTLIAGVSDVEEAARKLPMLQKFNGFPTTVIVDRKGVVRRIHTGFSGPATGDHYTHFVSEFKGSLEQLLAEGSG